MPVNKLKWNNNQSGTMETPITPLNRYVIPDGVTRYFTWTWLTSDQARECRSRRSSYLVRQNSFGSSATTTTETRKTILTFVRFAPGLGLDWNYLNKIIEIPTHTPLLTHVCLCERRVPLKVLLFGGKGRERTFIVVCNQYYSYAPPDWASICESFRCWGILYREGILLIE